MLIPIFIGIAVVLFIAGVLFIVNSIPSEETKAVPISNPKEIQKLKNTLEPPERVELSAEGPKTQQETGVEAIPQTKRAGPDPSEGSRMEEENHQLQEQIRQQKEKFEQLERSLEVLKKEYDRGQDQKAEKITALETENAEFRREKEQLLSKGELLNELKIKTELLGKQYEESQTQHAEMKAVINQLKMEKDDLMVRTRIKEDQLAEQLKTQRAEAGKTEFNVLSGKLVESISAIENLKRENKDLRQADLDLKNDFKRTEELNALLLEKERMMQYELTKNRAQALGLEKICEDFRTQIETTAASAAGDHQHA